MKKKKKKLMNKKELNKKRKEFAKLNTDPLILFVFLQRVQNLFKKNWKIFIRKSQKLIKITNIIFTQK